MLEDQIAANGVGAIVYGVGDCCPPASVMECMSVVVVSAEVHMNIQTWTNSAANIMYSGPTTAALCFSHEAWSAIAFAT